MKTHKFIKQTLELITSKNKKKLLLAIPVSILLSLLDLLGVILLGTLGTFSFKLLSGDTKPTRLELILKSILPIELSQINFMIAISFFAVFLLILKTLSQLYFNFKLSRFLANQETLISVSLFEKILHSNSRKVLSSNVTEYQYALLTGSARLVSSVLGGLLTTFTDGISILVLGFFAFLVSPAAFFGTLCVFLIVYLISGKFIRNKAEEYGSQSQEYSMNAHGSVLESIRGFKELKVYDKVDDALLKFSSSRSNLSLINQKTSWLSNILKYVFEIAILISAIVCGGILIYTTDARRTITVVVIFLAMGFRLIPSIQRIQNSFIGFRNIIGSSQKLFYFNQKFSDSILDESIELLNEEKYKLDSILLSNISLENPDDTKKLILDDISLELKIGKVVALIGQSGSGKTSLADLIVGLNSPTSGEVSYLAQGKVINSKLVSKGYVNQSPAMYGASLFENISFGVKNKSVDIERILDILEDLNLGDFVGENKDGQIKTREISMDSTNISGGEKQRIAIARALYADSRVIVLDEPSSALDKISQNLLISAISKIKQNRIIIIITHSDRLTSVCDYVVELNKGRIINEFNNNS